MAYSFNGTNQYLITTPAPVTTTPLTIAAWFTVNNLTAQKIIAQVNTSISGSVAGAYRIVVPINSSVLRALQNNPTSPQSSEIGGVTTGTWHHGAGVFVSSSDRTVYLNGTAGTTNTVSTAAPTIEHLMIGANVLNSTPAGLLSGLVAEVGFWNVALTGAEIASMARGVSPRLVRPQSLVFYSPLVRDLIDARGGVTITNVNGATVATHPRVYA